MHDRYSVILRSFLFLIVFAAVASNVPAQLKAEEIVAKHLASIGTDAKRAEQKSRLAVGLSEFESKLPARKTGGRAIVASDRENLMFLTSFNSQEYPFEKIGYFSKKVSLPWVTSGTRSPLGAFIADHERLLKDGLFTGAISANWSLLDLDRSGARIKADGSRKVDGRDAYVVDYFPKGGSSSEFSIKLFFDKETFHHLRSEYFLQINPRQDTFGTLGRQAGLRMQLSESYSDFKTVDGVTLPYKYSINYRTDSNSGVFEYIWGITVSEYQLNRAFADGFFTFEESKK